MSLRMEPRMTSAVATKLTTSSWVRRLRLWILVAPFSMMIACSGRSGGPSDAAAEVTPDAGGVQRGDAAVSGSGGSAGDGAGGAGGGDVGGGGSGGGGSGGGGSGGGGSGGGAAGVGGGGDAGTGGVDGGTGGMGGASAGTGGVATGGSGGSVGIIAIAAGGDDSCAIRADHTAFCWGDNTSSQLGDKKMGFANAAAISPAGDHTCALTTAGAVYCWGSNMLGGVGDGTVFPRAATLVKGLPLPATSIVAGRGATCAVLSDSTVMCWGSNAGDGTGILRLDPVAVVGLTGVTTLATGTETCALIKDGTVQCWGPAPVAMPDLANVKALSGNCALIADGTVKCWGNNNSGQFGDGTTTSSPTPVNSVVVSGVAAIAAGASFSCALLAADGSIHCWGKSAFGELGGPPPSTSLGAVTVTPGPAGFPARAVAIAVGSNHGLALLADGTVWGWGLNAERQIGAGVP